MDARARVFAAITGALACILHACTLSTSGIPGDGIGGGSTTSSTGGNGATTTSGSSGGGGSSGSTSSGTVEPDATCADGTRNGMETDVDCGGDACGPCGPGKGCTLDGDCATLACQGGSCAAVPVDPGCVASDQPTCNDCLKNGLETDLDCGGDDCAPCGPGAACGTDGDCETLSCDLGICAALPLDPGCEASDQPTCNDCVMNGLETGIDCGGDACGPCGPGETCQYDGDCASTHCTAGVCSLGQ